MNVVDVSIGHEKVATRVGIARVGKNCRPQRPSQLSRL